MKLKISPLLDLPWPHITHKKNYRCMFVWMNMSLIATIFKKKSGHNTFFFSKPLTLHYTESVNSNNFVLKTLFPVTRSIFKCDLPDIRACLLCFSSCEAPLRGGGSYVKFGLDTTQVENKNGLRCANAAAPLRTHITAADMYAWLEGNLRAFFHISTSYQMCRPFYFYIEPNQPQ